MTRMKKIEIASKKNWIDDLKNVIEDKITSFVCSMEANIDGREEDLEKYMEGLKEGQTKLLQERPPNEEKVVEETHDDKKKMLIMIS